MEEVLVSGDKHRPWFAIWMCPSNFKSCWIKVWEADLISLWEANMQEEDEEVTATKLSFTSE